MNLPTIHNIIENTNQENEKKQKKQRRNNQNDPKIIESKRQSLSYEAEQECAIVSLLMRHGVSFVMLKPRKMIGNSINSLEAFFITIQEVLFGSRRFIFNELIRNEILEGEQLVDTQEGLGKNRTKYLKRNLVSITNNFLSELLVRIGYDVKFKKSRMTSSVLKMNRIQSIVGHGISLETQRDIGSFGLEINKKLLDLFNIHCDRRDMPMEIGIEQLDGLITPEICYSDVLMSMLLEKGGKMIEQKQDEDYEDENELNEIFFLKLGYVIKRMEFGWFATSLKPNKM